MTTEQQETKMILQLEKNYDAAIIDRDLWKAEAERWRKMYMEYDEMLDDGLNEAKQQIEKVNEEIENLTKEHDSKGY